MKLLQQFDPNWDAMIQTLDVSLTEGQRLLKPGVLKKWLFSVLSDPEVLYAEENATSAGSSCDTTPESSFSDLTAGGQQFEYTREFFDFKRSIFTEDETSDAVDYSPYSCMLEQLLQIDNILLNSKADVEASSFVLHGIVDSCVRMQSNIEIRKQETIRSIKKEVRKKENDLEAERVKHEEFMRENLQSVGGRVTRSAPWLLLGVVGAAKIAYLGVFGSSKFQNS